MQKTGIRDTHVAAASGHGLVNMRSGAAAKTRPGWVRRILRQILVLLAIVAWIGAVVYPDPRPFVTSLARLKNPPIQAGAVTDIARTLPGDYAAIEDFAHEYVQFAPAWSVYGLPWYFPTVEEVIADRAGDCQARAILAASILEAKDMPYTLRYSFDHVWIDYPGKDFGTLEDPQTSFVTDTGTGWLPSIPDKFPVWSIINARIDFHWDPMPFVQKALLIAGILVIVGLGEGRLIRGFLKVARRCRARRLKSSPVQLEDA